MEINNIHDKYTKQTLADLSVTKDFLQTYLPEKVVAQMDLSTLQLAKDSFVDTDYQESFLDLLFQVHIAGKKSYTYCLFEHKTKPEKDIHLQLLTYMLQIWKQHAKQTDGEPLPVVLPIVIYHGQNRWNVQLKFSEQLLSDNEHLEIFKDFIPDFKYHLLDFSKHSKLDVVGKAKLQLYLTTIRIIMEKDTKKFQELLKQLAMDFQDQFTSEEFSTFSIFWFRYIIGVRDPSEWEAVQDTVKQLGGENIMSIEEWLKDEARKEGIEKGRQEGMEKSSFEIAKKMLKHGIALDSIMEMTGLTQGQVLSLEK